MAVRRSLEGPQIILNSSVGKDARGNRLGQPAGETAQAIQARSRHLLQIVLEFGESAGSERLGEASTIRLEEHGAQREHLLTARGP
jgi:hypothetical protein